jgi:hypothetical protein
MFNLGETESWLFTGAQDIILLVYYQRVNVGLIHLQAVGKLLMMQIKWCEITPMPLTHLVL